MPELSPEDRALARLALDVRMEAYETFREDLGMIADVESSRIFASHVGVALEQLVYRLYRTERTAPFTWYVVDRLDGRRLTRHWTKRGARTALRARALSL